MIAGAPYATVGSNSQQGASYVFLKPAIGWKNMSETSKLTSSDGKSADAFGVWVAAGPGGQLAILSTAVPLVTPAGVTFSESKS